jgi:hypothetical protein
MPPAPSSRTPRAPRDLGSWAARALAAAGIGFGVLAAWPAGREASAETKKKAAPQVVYEHGCRVQSPQQFLFRRTYVKQRITNPSKHDRALRYLVGHYGNAGDPMTTAWNPKEAASQAKSVRFFGLPVSVHEKIAPALACVEKRIATTCTGKTTRYTPHALGGFRTSNTYRGNEVSNHLLGIAIDVDPDRNPCCNCVDPWPNHPICQSAAKTARERSALTKCWIRSFERFGFDWLGHDELQDTMHFEFLGDPERIKRQQKTKKKR